MTLGCNLFCFFFHNHYVLWSLLSLHMHLILCLCHVVSPMTLHPLLSQGQTARLSLAPHQLHGLLWVCVRIYLIFTPGRALLGHRIAHTQGDEVVSGYTPPPPLCLSQQHQNTRGPSPTSLEALDTIPPSYLPQSSDRYIIIMLISIYPFTDDFELLFTVCGPF